MNARYNKAMSVWDLYSFITQKHYKLLQVVELYIAAEGESFHKVIPLVRSVCLPKSNWGHFHTSLKEIACESCSC